MVTDRGEGLDRAVATRAFEQPFSTGEGVLRKEKSGVGTGLHLARQLVVEHGGVMWTDPLPGRRHASVFLHPAPRGRAAREPPRQRRLSIAPPLDLLRPLEVSCPRGTVRVRRLLLGIVAVIIVPACAPASFRHPRPPPSC